MENTVMKSYVWSVATNVVVLSLKPMNVEDLRKGVDFIQSLFFSFQETIDSKLSLK